MEGRHPVVVAGHRTVDHRRAGRIERPIAEPRWQSEPGDTVAQVGGGRQLRLLDPASASAALGACDVRLERSSDGDRNRSGGAALQERPTIDLHLDSLVTCEAAPTDTVTASVRANFRRGLTR